MIDSKADIVEVMARVLITPLFGDLKKDLFGDLKKDPFEEAARILTALEAAGYVTVPREPTEAMLEAGAVAEGDGNLSVQALNIYAAMLAASPLGAKEVKKTPGIYHPQEPFEGEPPATAG